MKTYRQIVTGVMSDRKNSDLRADDCYGTGRTPTGWPDGTVTSETCDECTGTGRAR